MGDWVVLNRWNLSNKVHYWPKGHHLHGVCESGPCDYIVEHHQLMTDSSEVDYDVPEFIIETRYIDEDSLWTPGWRYVMRWNDNKRTKTVRGFTTREAAKAAAEAHAKEVALAAIPTHTYTYRPEL